MTLPAKNRQRLRLENQIYRYVFTAHKSLDKARLIIEVDHGQRPILLVQWVGLLDAKRDTIPRRFLCAVIEYGMSLGWPDSPGSQLELGCDATGEDLVFSERPEGSGNDWFFDSFPSIQVDSAS